ncbi:hypothetical protein P3T40_003552 [Paraburkholderia sp. EB58]|uniref:hypothetical protein n=1 Tax=Paraburkholderia sp. EB58 TaxID=3035125 RepID=UPI003D19112A
MDALELKLTVSTATPAGMTHDKLFMYSYEAFEASAKPFGIKLPSKRELFAQLRAELGFTDARVGTERRIACTFDAFKATLVALGQEGTALREAHK